MENNESGACAILGKWSRGFQFGTAYGTDLKLLTVDCRAIDERSSTVSADIWSRNANFNFINKKSIIFPGPCKQKPLKI